jgi:hypothetical protein
MVGAVRLFLIDTDSGRKLVKLEHQTIFQCDAWDMIYQAIGNSEKVEKKRINKNKK